MKTGITSTRCRCRRSSSLPTRSNRIRIGKPRSAAVRNVVPPHTPVLRKQHKQEPVYEKFRKNHLRRHAPREHASPHLVWKIGGPGTQLRRRRRQRGRHLRRVQVPQTVAVRDQADDLQLLLLPRQHGHTGRFTDEYGEFRPRNQDARRRHRSDSGARQRGAEPQQTRPAARDRRCDGHRLSGRFRPGGGLHGW